jgi:ABC-type phosphate transport system permease subunit
MSRVFFLTLRNNNNKRKNDNRSVTQFSSLILFAMSLSVIMMILLLFYVWILCSTTKIFRKNYFNRKMWFDDGNIFHIDQQEFGMVFQQHRNVNRQYVKEDFL